MTIQEVLERCLGRRLRVYSRDENTIQMAFDVMITGVTASPSHVTVTNSGPFRTKNANRMEGGNTLRVDELRLCYQSETLTVLEWRGHTRFNITPH